MGEDGRARLVRTTGGGISSEGARTVDSRSLKTSVSAPSDWQDGGRGKVPGSLVDSLNICFSKQEVFSVSLWLKQPSDFGGSLSKLAVVNSQ